MLERVWAQRATPPLVIGVNVRVIPVDLRPLFPMNETGQVNILVANHAHVVYVKLGLSRKEFGRDSNSEGRSGSRQYSPPYHINEGNPQTEAIHYRQIGEVVSSISNKPKATSQQQTLQD